MTYLRDVLLPLMRDGLIDTAFNTQSIALLLWHNVTNQAYLQRSDLFDGTWFASSDSDAYVALRLKDALRVSEVCLYDNSTDCSQAIEQFANDNKYEGCLHIVVRRGKESLFFSFWRRIRNALAHGTFCTNDHRYYMLGQKEAKPESSINFYLQTSADLDTVLRDLWLDFVGSLPDIPAFMLGCLKSVLDLAETADGLYSRKYNRFVVVDAELNGSSPTRGKDDIPFLLETHSAEQAKDVLILSRAKGNLSDKNLTSKDGLIRVVPTNKIIDFYGIAGVMFPQKAKHT